MLLGWRRGSGVGFGSRVLGRVVGRGWEPTFLPLMLMITTSCVAITPRDVQMITRCMPQPLALILIYKKSIFGISSPPPVSYRLRVYT